MMITFPVIYSVSLNKKADQFQCSLYEDAWRPCGACRWHKMLKTPPGVHRCITATNGDLRGMLMKLV